MVKEALITSCLLAGTFALFARHGVSGSVRSATPPEQIALHEAEILIYLIPEAHELRNQGMDIGWEVETSTELNQQDFYTFWVVNSKRSNVQGSVTIGYFGVNKHTADLWNYDREKAVSTNEIEGVKRILRRAHNIDESTVQRFSSLRPKM